MATKVRNPIQQNKSEKTAFENKKKAVLDKISKVGTPKNAMPNVESTKPTQPITKPGIRRGRNMTPGVPRGPVKPIVQPKVSKPAPIAPTAPKIGGNATGKTSYKPIKATIKR